MPAPPHLRVMAFYGFKFQSEHESCEFDSQQQLIVPTVATLDGCFVIFLLFFWKHLTCLDFFLWWLKMLFFNCMEISELDIIPFNDFFNLCMAYCLFYTVCIAVGMCCTVIKGTYSQNYSSVILLMLISLLVLHS